MEIGDLDDMDVEILDMDMGEEEGKEERGT